MCQMYHSGPPRSLQRLLAAGGLQDHGPVGAGWSTVPRHVQCPLGWPWDTGHMDKISCRNVQFSKHVLIIGAAEGHISFLTTFYGSEMKSESNVIRHSDTNDLSGLTDPSVGIIFLSEQHFRIQRVEP